MGAVKVEGGSRERGGGYERELTPRSLEGMGRTSPGFFF